MTPAMHRALDLHDAYDPRPGGRFDEVDAEALRRNRIRQSITLDSWPHKIAAFRSLYCLDQHNLDSPGMLRPERTALHRMLLQEEFAEVMEAVNADSEAEVFLETVDGLLDLIYIALGWLAEMGLEPTLINRLMDEVHASNLTKTDDAGLPLFRPDGKVMKGANYLKADLAAVLRSNSTPLTSQSADDTTDVPEQTEGNDG